MVQSCMGNFYLFASVAYLILLFACAPYLIPLHVRIEVLRIPGRVGLTRTGLGSAILIRLQCVLTSTTGHAVSLDGLAARPSHNTQSINSQA
jgi:hypothetical protein